MEVEVTEVGESPHFHPFLLRTSGPNNRTLCLSKKSSEADQRTTWNLQLSGKKKKNRLFILLCAPQQSTLVRLSPNSASLVTFAHKRRHSLSSVNVLDVAG